MRIAAVLCLAMAATACYTVDHTVKRSDGLGNPTRVIKLEVGGVASMGTSAGDMANAYSRVKGADTDEMVCKADPNSARCVVGGIQDPRTAADILRRGYGRPFGGSARVYPLAGAPARLATAADQLAAGPETTPLAPPPSPRLPETGGEEGGGGGDSEFGDIPSPHRMARNPVLAQPAAVGGSIVRCSALRLTLSRARDKIKEAQAARKGLKRDADEEAVTAAQATIKQLLADAGRMLGDGISACATDPQAIRELVEVRAKIPGLRATYGLPKEG